VEIFGVKIEAIIRLVRELVVTAFVAVIAYKLLGANLSFDFTKLSPTDLVALLLAVFSVGLSAAFFFAATGSSSKFYDNMHKFTKDTSVILGQLTEKLKNLDKSQHEVKERFDRLYTPESKADDEAIAERERQKESKVNEDRDDLKNTIESWLEKYQIDAQEKEKFKAVISAKEEQLSQSLKQLSELQSEQKGKSYKRVKSHISFIVRESIMHEITDFESVVARVLRGSGESRFKQDLVDAGLLDHPSSTEIENLTEDGLAIINEAYHRNMDN